MLRPASTRAALCVVLAAMMLRALVPAGWMPAYESTSDGAYIVICSSSGMKTIYIDGNGMPAERDESASAPDGCAFGNTVAFGLTAALPAAALLASVEAAPVEALRRLDGTSVGFRRVRDPPVPA